MVCHEEYWHQETTKLFYIYLLSSNYSCVTHSQAFLFCFLRIAQCPRLYRSGTNTPWWMCWQVLMRVRSTGCGSRLYSATSSPLTSANCYFPSTTTSLCSGCTISRRCCYVNVLWPIHGDLTLYHPLLLLPSPSLHLIHTSQITLYAALLSLSYFTRVTFLL